MNCYNNSECQPRRLKFRFKQANQTDANAYLLPWPPNSDAEFRPLPEKKKQLTSCQRLITFLQAKEWIQTLDYFHPFIGWSRSLHCHPQEIFSLPDIKLTLGICQSHLKHYRVTDYVGAVFNHSACQKSVPCKQWGDYHLTQPTFGLTDIGFRGESLR